jgi:predicted amidohydrolase
VEKDVMNKSFKVMGFQIQSKKDLDNNLNKHVENLEKYSSDVDMFVYPELFSTGYIMDKDYFNENAMDTNDEKFKSVLELSRKHNTNVLFPFLERCGDKLYNSVAVINRSGELLGIKRKFINWKTENGYLDEAPMKENLRVFQVDGIKVGILLCYEVSFAETDRYLKKQGVELIVIMSFWDRSAESQWIYQIATRAADNNVFAIGVNGFWKEHTCGNSMMANPNGDIVANLGHEEGTIVFEITKKQLEEEIDMWPYYEDYMAYNMKDLLK